MTNTYLQDWPSVDLDDTEIPISGIEALLAHEIDIIVTPDPVLRPELSFILVFEYEQVLVVYGDHPLRGKTFVEPEELSEEILFTYPVCSDRLDIFTNFLTPVGRTVKYQKIIETTEIMIQMVARGRGVTALPRWMVQEYAERYDIHPIKLGKKGCTSTSTSASAQRTPKSTTFRPSSKRPNRNTHLRLNNKQATESPQWLVRISLFGGLTYHVKPNLKPLNTIYLH